jgi:hypothetical protein
MAGAIVNPRELSISHPNGRLRNRQRIIRARMGNVTPPPTIAAPVDAGPTAMPDTLPEPPEETSPLPPAEEPPPDSAPPATQLPSAERAPEHQSTVPVPQPFPGAARP